MQEQNHLDSAPAKLYLTSSQEEIFSHHLYCPFMSFSWQTDKELYFFWIISQEGKGESYHFCFWAGNHHVHKTSSQSSAGRNWKLLIVGVNPGWGWTWFAGMNKLDICLGERKSALENHSQSTLHPERCKTSENTSRHHILPLHPWQDRKSSSPVKKSVLKHWMTTFGRTRELLLLPAIFSLTLFFKEFIYLYSMWFSLTTLVTRLSGFLQH